MPFPSCISAFAIAPLSGFGFPVIVRFAWKKCFHLLRHFLFRPFIEPIFMLCRCLRSCPSYVHGSHPAAVRLVMNLWFVTFLPTFGNSISISAMRHFSAGDRSILFLRSPDHFQQVLISSPACALIRFYVTILISMPIGHWVRTIFGGMQVSFGYCFHSPTHCSGFFHASNLTFLLPRSAYIVSMFYGWIFTRIASSKVPFLTLLRSRSRFSGGSLV